jgi:hypothetical protein
LKIHSAGEENSMSIPLASAGDFSPAAVLEKRSIAGKSGVVDGR